MTAIERLGPGELPGLDAFYRELGLTVPRENLEQFCAPRVAGGGLEVVTLVLRDASRILGTIGWIDVPLRCPAGLAEGGTTSARWPINNFLLPEWRGRGHGKALMEATRAGARRRFAMGGTDVALPMRAGSGWVLVGHLSCIRWLRPCLRPSRLVDRLRPAVRREPPGRLRLRWRGLAVQATRVPRLDGWLPWADPGPGPREECGVPRDAAYLDFAWGGALRPCYTLHAVAVNGALAGFFVLGARSERRGILGAEIVDLDAVAGREAPVMAAARAAALSCADVARLRIAGDRFVRAASEAWPRARVTRDLPLRVICEDPAESRSWAERGIGGWRLTYGDHDQYRRRGNSAVWAAPPTGVTAAPRPPRS